MIEKVARALYTDYEGGITMGMKDIMHDCAKRAITALKEPTEEMKNQEEVHWNYSCHVCGGLQEGWNKMIDKALSE